MGIALPAAWTAQRERISWLALSLIQELRTEGISMRAIAEALTRQNIATKKGNP